MAARPDTGFARDLFAGSAFGLVQLSHTDILPGSESGFVEVRDAPTGFMLIARGVFERLAEHRPDLRYTPGPNDDEAAASRPHYRFFDTLAEPGNGQFLSEDFAFCRRWREAGGHVFIDTRSDLTHQGQRSYCGNLARALALRN
jgi:hypothetical protein